MLKRLDHLISGGNDAEASDPLAQLASRINAAHEAAEACFTKGVAYAVEAGKDLLHAKKLVEDRHGYGHWQDWRKRNVKFPSRTARLYMQMAGLPEEERQRVAPLSLREAAKAVAKKAKRGRRIAKGNGSPLPPELRVGDFREVLADIEPGSADLIFTDPLYQKASIPLYGDLAAFAARALKPSGWLLAYSGSLAMPEYMNLLGQHLQYGLVVACVQLGGPRLLLHSGVINRWRPILCYYKPPLRRLREPTDDMLVRENRPEKQWDEYQQQLKEAVYLVHKFSEPGDLVIDPFLGSGTTVVAARALGRRSLAAEINPEAVAAASARLASEEEAARAAALADKPST